LDWFFFTLVDFIIIYIKNPGFLKLSDAIFEFLQKQATCSLGAI
jgi:hypothetical protein